MVRNGQNNLLCSEENSMSVKLSLLFVLVIIAGVFFAAVPNPLDPAQDMVYIDGALYLQETETLSVIVTAVNPVAAVRAVEAVGGQVTSDPGLDNAITANIPYEQLDVLVNHPDIRSVANNTAG
jgi:hypothetical protein